MDAITESIRRAVDHSDGGVSLLRLEAGNAPALFRQLSLAADRTGFVPVLADAEARHELPPALLHRHVAIVCEGVAGRRAAIAWMRRLAQASPRQHVAVACGAVTPTRLPAAVPGAVPPAVAVRIARAERWRRRGRIRAAEHWLAAASASARRYGDPATASRVECRLAADLIVRDQIDCAGLRLRRLLGGTTEWADYSAAGVLWADALIAREDFGSARAWSRSLAAEAELRGVPWPDGLAARTAELDFWQGRHPGKSDYAIPDDPDEAGWRALQAWSVRELPWVAAAAARLAARQRTDVCAAYWLAVLRVLLAGGTESGEAQARVHDLKQVAIGCSGRRKRFATVVVARALAPGSDAASLRRLLDDVRGPGPETSAASRLAALRLSTDSAVSGPPQRKLARSAPGIELLSSGSQRMHLVDSLSGLLSVMEEAGDEVAVLIGGCRWLCRQADAVRAALVSVDRTTLVAAEGWRRADLAGEIAEILAGPAGDVRLGGHDSGSGGFGVSVRYGGVTAGYVVVRGLPSDRPALQPAAQALAVLCGPALRARMDSLTATQRARQSIPEIVGDSPLIGAVREAITRAAPAPFPVLIEGESGTGKELVARALHRLGPRRDRRMSAVNCAALTDELLEAELFGHTRGAFTGAIGPRAGLFEEAHGGTLFLDEVTDLSPRAQAKLLRVLQEGEIRRVGENQPRPVDVRILAACNVPVADAVARGRFRDDLRFRLAVIRISVPPLRERLEDVPVLAQVFWRRTAEEAGTQAALAPDALARLTRHPWPGNVRELQNVIAGLVVAAPRRGRVGARHVEQALSHVAGAPEMPGVPLEAARRAFERRVVMAALVRHAGRRNEAAAELGLTRQGLTKALRRLGLAADEQAAGVA